MSATEQIAGPWQHRQAVVRGLRFHCVEAGAEAGPLVVLLHGFPEFWYSWRYQIPALADAGFHVLAPDMRGYNETDKPPGIENYRMDVLVEDVVGLIEDAGAKRAVVVGHDWGGAIAWTLAIRHPERVERLVILNAPHPAAFRREIRTLAQLRRSAYIFFFQLPWLPEWMLARDEYAFLDRLWRNHPGFTAEDIGYYKRALAHPGARTATLNYYRAVLRYPGQSRHDRVPIVAPTLVLWGERDPYLGIRLTEGLERWVPRLQMERLADLGHWVQMEAPERVNRLMLDFLAPGSRV
jgi:pimeloyl-ACP methyl ester carboxylesterase